MSMSKLEISGATHMVSTSAQFFSPSLVSPLFVISSGRFFAVNEVKLLLAHLLVTYDMKFEKVEAPPDHYIATLRVPRYTLCLCLKDMNSAESLNIHDVHLGCNSPHKVCHD